MKRLENIKELNKNFHANVVSCLSVKVKKGKILLDMKGKLHFIQQLLFEIIL
jgi:hypothetical protein